MATGDQPIGGVRFCNCVGYLTNPGGRCCMDFPQGRTITSDRITVNPEPEQEPMQWKVIRAGGIAVAQGWECPRCKVILAPHVDKCECQERNL